MTVPIPNGRANKKPLSIRHYLLLYQNALHMCKIYKEVLHLVAEETEISAILIESKSRLDDVVNARQMVAYFCARAGMSPRNIAEKLGISRQAVCQKIASIDDKRMLRSFEFIYKRVESQFVKLFPNEGCK